MGVSASVSTREDLVGPVNDGNIKSWTKEDVAKWLRVNNFPQYADKFYENDIDGEALVLLNQETLTSLGVSIGNAAKIHNRVHSELGDLASLKRNSSTLTDTGAEQEEEKAIAVGMKKMEKVKGWHELPPSQQRMKVRSLVVKQALSKAYFDTDYVATKRFTMDLINQKGDEQETKEMLKTMKKADILEGSTAEAPDLPLQSVADSNNIEDFTNEEILQLSNAPRKTLIQPQEYLKVKLVIVEIHTSSSTLRMLTPIMDTFNFSPQFGMFHSALIVGPWYLEWNDSGLVVPRKCYAGAAILAADVEKYFRGPQVNEALDKITDIISQWNATKQYSQHFTNCQHFVDDLCKALDINLEFNGALKNFIQELRTTGYCDQISEHTENFDAFVQMVMRAAPDYFDIDRCGKDDWLLLKSYDRAFWLRHFKYPTDLSFCQHSDFECPFRNPTASGSLAPNFYTYKRMNGGSLGVQNVNKL
ncbi:SAMD7 [Acrasis kona]|uniref:SAMD7 n=1 Tax=Acrasis kona TaxID=1008807 RepID=A0AAW2ZBG3_9EUKA